MENVIYSVNDINRYIKNILTHDESLKYIYVRGEISNYKPSSSGHLYLSLKDKDSLISAIMFANYANKLIFNPKNGDEVIVLASIDAYSARGTYNLIIYEMSLAGQGNILIELEKLKKKLASEGLFDEARKKKLPLYPYNIGVITAKNSAAIKDFSTNLFRRYPLAYLYFFPSSVQGEEASKELLKAYLKAQEYDLDVLIIGRGGGQSEDLNAFNDEALVRAVAESKMPVISAVGHEIDVTLIDYVADKRASTPTGAIELATPDISDMKNLLALYRKRINNSLTNLVNSYSSDVARYQMMMENILKDKLNNYRYKLSLLKQRLNDLNPSNVLERGYAMISKDGKTISSSSSLHHSDEVIATFKDGTAKMIVEDINHE